MHCPGRTHTHTHTHVDLELNPWVKNSQLKIDMLSTLATPPHFRAARVWPFGPAASFFFLIGAQPAASLDQARMVNEGVMVPLMLSFRRLAALVLLAGCAANNEKTRPVSVPPRRGTDDCWQRQSNTSALNTALAFELYQDLATRTTGQQQQQQNILLSPLGLVSVLVLLSQVPAPESQSQVLGALGLAANSTEVTVVATISTLTDLLHNLTVQEGGVGREVQRAELDEAGRGVGTGAFEGASAGEPVGQNTSDVEDGAEGSGRNEDQVHGGARLRVWSGLRVHGTSSPHDESSLYGKISPTSDGTVFNVSLDTLLKDLQASDKLELNNHVYMKGSFWFV